DFDCIDALVMPGGESTTISKFMLAYGADDAVRKFAACGGRILATCAGMVLAAKTGGGDVERSGQTLLGLIDAEVSRNAFGRQRESFEQDIPIPVLGGEPFHCIFIRAPCYTKIGAGVEVLARLDEKIIAVKSGKIIALSFHPELSSDKRLLEYFLKL
ncbi:MAG TPA: pyridoxal 5'-phosphate synthase glutaminase subunit PdxT, partial [Candidatus Altiarchaeales archaeon]|nr:pyridoxal 5'-phosphate synthase glutaminase subunit PdxT [Candidatus Altiarchaeales archaeon]